MKKVKDTHDYSTRRRRKYRNSTEPVPPKITREDAHCLAKLVEKYGAEVIKAASPIVKKRRRGRPSRGLLPVYEMIHFAEWIDERIEELRAAGVKAPVQKARVAAFEMQSGGKKPSDAELETIKKRHLQGRKMLSEPKAAHEKHSLATKRKKKEIK